MTDFINVAIIVFVVIIVFDGIALIFKFVDYVRKFPKDIEQLKEYNREQTEKEIKDIKAIQELYDAEYTIFKQQYDRLSSSYNELYDMFENFIKPISDKYAVINMLEMYLTSGKDEKERYRADYIQAVENEITLLESRLERVKPHDKDIERDEPDPPNHHKGISR